jgi:type I restriction enzyme, S subunit
MAGDARAGGAIGLSFDIPVDWEAPRLSIHCDFVRDGDWIESKDQGGADYRLLQISNIGIGRFVETGNYRWITQETFQRLNCTEIVPGDVLVARMPEPTGRAWHVPELPWRAVTAVDVAIIRPKPDELDPRFLAYFLNSPACLGTVRSLTTGTTRLRIRRADVEGLQVPLPSPKEQRAIAHILGSLDDKIELNRRLNETLEAMARALFRSWFVDFDPVRAKAKGRDPGLPTLVADLFSDRLVDSELGEIPAGWKILGLDEIARFLNGLALQKYPPNDGRSLPVIKIAQLHAGNVEGADEASADLEADYIVEDGDVLFSWSGSLDCVVWAGGRGALNQHLFKVTSTECQKWFYYFWIHEHLGDFQQIAAGKATTMGHIQRHHLSAAKVVVPPPELLREADGVIAPLLDGVWRRSVQSRTIADLRDTLLPKLISGELRVPQAERMLEAAPT